MNRTDAFWRCKRCGTPNPRAGYLTHCLGCGAERLLDGTSEAPAGSETPRRASSRLGRWTIAACWLYAVATAGLVALVAVAGDRWWPTTFLVFGPRWIWLTPLAVLIPAAVLARRRGAVWPLLVGSVLAVGPWLGFCVPWRSLAGGAWPPGLLRVRVLTCNVEGGRAVGLPALIASIAPDVVIVEECPAGSDLAASLARMPAPGWHFRFENGLGLASRFPIDAVEFLSLQPGGSGGTIGRFTLATPIGRLDVFGLHLKTPREGLEAVIEDKWAGVPDLLDNITRRTAESEAASRWVAQSPAAFLIAGDFNLPTDSLIYKTYWSSFANAFSRAGFGLGASKFTRWHGLRIDHVLAGPGWRARRCWVGPEVGSDHRPVVAELDWSPPD